MSKLKQPARSASTPSSCFTCQNRDRTEWCVLAEDDIALIDRIKVSRSYQPGQIIYTQGDPTRGIFCIEAGTVAIRKMERLVAGRAPNICGALTAAPLLR